MSHVTRETLAAAAARDLEAIQHRDKPLTPKAFELVKVVPVGGYALQPRWADGHDTGIYSFEYLARLG